MILLIIARWLRSILFPIGFVFSTVYLLLVKRDRKAYKRYCQTIAFGEDQLGNVYLQHLFNFLFIKKNGYKFGNVDEPISSVLGKNKRMGTLTVPGIIFAWFLNLWEKNHVEMSIEENP